MSGTPLISIITPSFNCARYIRQCIESIAGQGYPRFEHVVVDGGSKDGTLEILKEHPHVRWVSEPDRGEGDALNKALRMAQGDIIGWLNADDYYLEGALPVAAREIDPERGRHLIYGKANLISEDRSQVDLQTPVPQVTLASLVRWWSGFSIFQPAMFYSRKLVDDVGPFRDDLHFSIDYEYWLRAAAKGYAFHYVDFIFAEARLERADSKSSASVFAQHRSWHEEALPFVRMLPLAQQARFWVGLYYGYRVRRWLSPLRRALRSCCGG